MGTEPRSVVLSGFLATGKSILAPRVASELGLPYVDTDEELARRTGTRVPDLWRERGEAAFRALEAGLVRELFADGVARVVAFGGGTVTMREIRHLALDRALVVTLTARPETVLARIQDLDDRPTLASPDPRARVTSLLEQRADAYAECHLRLATDDRAAAELVSQIARRAQDDAIAVPLGGRTYTVELVVDRPEVVRRALAELAPSSLLVVTDANVLAARGGTLDASLPRDVRATRVVLPPGENHKTLESVRTIWDAALAGGGDRDAVVVAFGGGVIGDLAGFAASTLRRGLRVVHVPTTLLAMVDASVGGKTGFDVPAGKNLVGSFHQPATVVADLAHLATLAPRDRVAGLAEVAKVALALDGSLWEDLERHAEALRAGDVPALLPVLRRALRLKARLVAQDERDSGARALLNLGHTVGHALEAAGAYSRHRHGEAVALGLVAETRAAERLGDAARGTTDRVAALLRRLGLPTEVSEEEITAAWPFVGHDKKRAGDSVSLPLVHAVGTASLRQLCLVDFARALGIEPR